MTCILVLCGATCATSAAAAATAPSRDQPVGIHKIRHIVIVMQENRSFDSYFGTYPGADGIPMYEGHPSVCVPDPKSGQCVAPYHDTSDVDRKSVV